MNTGRIGVVALQEKFDKKISALLGKEGWEVRELEPHVLIEGPLPDVDVVLLYFGKDGAEAGLAFLRAVKEKSEELPVICLSKSVGVEQVVGLMKGGAFDYFEMPPHFGKLKLSLGNAIRTTHLTKKVMVLESQVGWQGKFDDLVGTSASMLEIFQMIQTVSKSNATVLVMGESGTGKELVARAIHRHSDRSANKFIDINCGAIPKELLENELFGHERGAYTGADRLYIGSCERAGGGTLFLDEVSEMDAALQVKLLRVIQERCLTRVGGTERIELDIRIVAATNKDLRAEVTKGTFREDLFYRLNVVPIVIPPLRVRPDDVPLLAQHFLEKFNEENRKRFKGFTPEAMEVLMNYDWPGNVRELENNIERVVVLSDDSKVKPAHLPRFIVNTEKKLIKNLFPGGDAYQKILSLDQVERYAIEAAINRCRGDVLVAARKLGIGQATLYRKIKRYKIRV